ncbi:hypothetical protein MO973_20710 [Paenibacillus sp. TRM 82003]|nr:hypothetical protein [Paenibacillus sp. TRM 82003]
MEYLSFGLMITIIAITVIYLQQKRTRLIGTDSESDGGNENNNIDDALFPCVISGTDVTDLSAYSPPRQLHLSSPLLNTVHTLINAAPKAKDLVKTQQQIVVKFNPEIMKKLQSGELTRMKAKNSTDKLRTMVVDKKNRIRGHGHVEIENIKKVNPAQLANAALGVMSVVTAQEYLDRIDQQLKKLDKKVDTIIRRNLNDKFGIARGSIDYLMSLFPRIFEIENEEIKVYNNKLGDIIHQCFQQIVSLIVELPVLIRQIKNLEVNSLLKIENPANKVSEEVAGFQEIISLSLSNLEVMLICLNLRSELRLSDPIINKTQVEQAEKYLKQITGFYDEFITSANNKISEINPKFRPDRNNINTRRNKLHDMIEHVRGNLEQKISDVKETKDFKRDKSAQLFDLKVEYDPDGNITAVYKLGFNESREVGA